jgi:hypothetical protein
MMLLGPLAAMYVPTADIKGEWEPMSRWMEHLKSSASSKTGPLRSIVYQDKRRRNSDFETGCHTKSATGIYDIREANRVCIE